MAKSRLINAPKHPLIHYIFQVQKQNGRKEGKKDEGEREQKEKERKERIYSSRA